MIEQPIFIGGSGRSGTTVLGHILASHPDILYFSEPRFLIDEGGVIDFIAGKLSVEQFSDWMIDHYQNKLVNSIEISISLNSNIYDAAEIFSIEVIKKILSNSFRANFNRIEAATMFVANIFQNGLLAMQKIRCVEKTPHTFLMAHVLYEMFPDLKYIHTIRDPKDVCCSMMPLSWGPNSITEFILYYKSMMIRALQSLSALPANQLLTVELENLTKRPIETIKAIFEFLGLQYSAEQLSTYANVIKKPKDANVYRYLKDLSSEDSEKIDQQCKDLYLDLCDLSNSDDHEY